MKNFDPAVYKEVFELGCYDRYVQLEPDDIVLDLGCSAGYFYFKHKDKISHYYGIDGSLDCLNDFIINLDSEDTRPYLINTLIDRERKIVEFPSMFHNDQIHKVMTTTFLNLIELINRPVDFLKFDIESWETVFWETPQALSFFKAFVKKFTGEIHFLGQENNRIVMMNNLVVLKNDPEIDFKLFSVDGVDITNYFWTNPNFYSEIIISGKINKC